MLEIELHIPAAQSLKQKRTVLKSLKDRTSSKFNVSLAEVGYMDKWQRAALAVVSVSSDRTHLEQQLAQVLRFMESELLGSATILKRELSFL